MRRYTGNEVHENLVAVIRRKAAKVEALNNAKDKIYLLSRLGLIDEAETMDRLVERSKIEHERLKGYCQRYLGKGDAIIDVTHDR